MRKKEAITASALAVIAMGVTGCSALYRGVEGNLYEKMTIFSMIVVTVAAVIIVPFLTGKGEKDLSRYRDVIRDAAGQPLTKEELTGDPVYFWDSRRSFRKMFFGEDGALYESSIITANGQDPDVRLSGSWELTADGVLQITPRITGRPRKYCRISTGGCGVATMFRLSSCYAEAWYLGRCSLPHVQISCFGYSASAPPAEKFTAPLVSGATVYWATYPCILPVASDVVCVNPELAFGMITFDEDGTVAKSINNPVGAAPDYTPSFSGTWRIDELHGALNLNVGLYTAEVTLLLHDHERETLLVRTAAGNEIWFLHREEGKRDLARYLATGVYLDAGKSDLFI